jgi:hypothetical protein
VRQAGPRLEIFWDARSVNRQSSSNDRDGYRIGIGDRSQHQRITESDLRGLLHSNGNVHLGCTGSGTSVTG